MAPQSSSSKHQTEKPLRQLAAEKLHGKGSNPSQLGDPVSLKAEAADSHPTDQDLGSRGSNNESNSRASPDQGGSSSKTRTPPSSSGGSHEQKQLKGGRGLRGMVEEKVSQVKKGGNKSENENEPAGHDKGRAPTAKL
ncbi:uncharacterized protein K452DRAFT_320270 [Aplosporella prunicola CBS 121167]|uniref:Uncharacterized protein n=1 Tax=Aplosporella prunicola CBS 121167 TaxID=1176127 RepID=A0A6A6B6J6_9PEZI|nr:uncharacterized protein K452DRAFT_320270 [Aplosporella prunicola CBS 121167]KAF2139630.1 hypothetical protein K452DRAFT_320270 [Aplosporella prunicola CBS 121167]